ncbi:MAG TPA: aminoglycoside phosphotransferase family protein, partial [Ktedonobacteraceae bacterium]
MPELVIVERIVARHFPHSFQIVVQQVEEGGSTYVYRIHNTNEIFYLRVLPEIGASFAPEVKVHQALREKQVKVPEVLYFEHENKELGRSIMLTREIKGKHLGYCGEQTEQRNILLEAGRDLAIINNLPVKNFGWIRRDSPEATSLEATFLTYRAFVYEHLERDLAALEEQVFAKSTINNIRQILHRFDNWLSEKEPAWLAHGDFDATHIYQDQGRYTGIIDFGEIRGTNSWYDLGHFNMHDGESLPKLMLPYLIEGYQEVAPPPSDNKQRVSFSGLLIAIRALARS